MRKKKLVIDILIIAIPILLLIYPVYKIMTYVPTRSDRKYLTQVLESISKTDTVVISKLSEYHASAEQNYAIKKTIVDSSTIENLVEILKDMQYDGPAIVGNGPEYKLELLDSDENVLATFKWSPLMLKNDEDGSYFRVKLDSEEYIEKLIEAE